jgi:hypothetical protein
VNAEAGHLIASGKAHPALTFERASGWDVSTSSDGKLIVFPRDDFEESNR